MPELTNIFESIMLICFGISWPISIAKSLRTKQVRGKSALFMVLILIGYISGIMFKVVGTMDWVILLYVFNALMVAIDLGLYQYYSSNNDKSPAPQA